MKKVLLSILTIGTIGFFSSCSTTKDDAKPGPSITAKVTNGGSSTTLTGSSAVAFTIDYSTGEDFKALSVTEKTSSGSTTSPINPVTGKFTNKETISFTDTPTMTTEYTFTVTDSKGATASSMVNVVIATPLANVFSSYSAKSLIATGYSTTGPLVSNGQFFSSKTGATGGSGTWSTTSSDIDISYEGGKFYSPSTKPAKGSLTGLTATSFGTYAGNYDAATVSEISSAATGGSTDINVTNGGVYWFKNTAGKVGLIKVTSYTAGDAGSVTFDVKVQQ